MQKKIWYRTAIGIINALIIGIAIKYYNVHFDSVPHLLLPLVLFGPMTLMLLDGCVLSRTIIKSKTKLVAFVSLGISICVFVGTICGLLYETRFEAMITNVLRKLEHFLPQGMSGILLYLLLFLIAFGVDMLGREIGNTLVKRKQKKL